MKYLLLCSLLIPSSVLAQDTVVVHRDAIPLGLPAADRAVRIFNLSETRRAFGTDSIGPNDVVTASVGIYLGTLHIEGTVLGDVVAVNANLVLAAGADVRGDVLVLGGTITESRDARLGGTLERHSPRVDVRREGARLILESPPAARRTFDRSRRLRRSRRTGDADLVIATEGAYNRVDGLPVLLGPELRWGTRPRLRLRALGVFRTAAGLSAETREIGYRVESSLRFAENEWSVELGGRFSDVTSPVERWKLSDAEIGLASFLLHRDYRDYYLDRGLAGHLTIRPTPDVALGGAVARREMTSVAARDPWTPFRNDAFWRANPPVDEGNFTELTTFVELDTRRELRWGGTGIVLRGEWLHGVADDDVQPLALSPSVRPTVPADWTYDGLTGDVRLYQPIGFGGLMLRAYGSGVVGAGPLPVQHRLSLGGPEPLPGYTFRRFACNGGVALPGQPALCDRLMLFQAEWRGSLDIDPFDWDDWGDWHDDHRNAHRHTALPPGRRAVGGVPPGSGRGGAVPPGGAGRGWDWDGPDLVLFADAGSAWLRGNSPGRLHWDLGAGLAFGGFGIYLARAIASEEPVRFLIRLHQRF